MTKSLIFELLRSNDEASYTYNSKQPSATLYFLEKCRSDILSSILMPTNKNFSKSGPPASPRASEFIGRTYVHELGNILDLKLNPNGNGRTYGMSGNQTGDNDSGQVLEDCVFGPYDPHGGKK
jgi:hypothetical protein